MSFAESPEEIASPDRSANRPRSVVDWVTAALAFCFVVAVVVSAFYPLFIKQSWIPFEEDDFFYYLKVAQNLAHGNGSTFNGLVSTNGYHPLWFVLIAIVSFISASATAIKIFLSVAITVSTLSTYFLSRALLYRAGLRRFGREGLLANALACYCAIYSMHLYISGMEVTLTVPLILLFACQLLRDDLWSGGLACFAGLGLLVSAIVLSRLDSAILIAVLFVGIVLHPELRKKINGVQVAGLVVGIIPLLFYFVSNQIFFHTWLPVSGMAKQLKMGHHPSAAAWNSLFAKTHAQLMNVAVVMIAILLLPFLFRRLTAMQQVLFSGLLLFPFLYLSVLSFVSDWKLWDWYFYAFRPAFCVSLILFLMWQPTGWLMRNAYVTALIALFMFVYVTKIRRTSVGGDTMYQTALFVQNFSQTHPGIYAMGDRAGMVGYLLRDPLVQTEGLVMDREFLDVVKQRTPLRQALEKYGVRYYISVAVKPYTGCYHATEPYEAGPASPHMVAEFCEPPVAEFTDTDGLKTLIYEIE